MLYNSILDNLIVIVDTCELVILFLWLVEYNYIGILLLLFFSTFICQDLQLWVAKTCMVQVTKLFGVEEKLGEKETRLYVVSLLS